MARLEYTVSMENPASHYFSVKIKAFGAPNSVGASVPRIVMPVWTPGSYSIRDFSRNIMDVRASDASGRELRVVKTTKNSWEIRPASEDFTVEYKAYAFAKATSASYLDTERGVINGASVFVYVDGLQTSTPIALRVVPYPGWNTISTGLPRAGKEFGLFEAKNFDVLIDSPIEVGNQHVHAFQVDGLTHEVSIFAPLRFNEEQLVADTKRIVENTIPIFEHTPYSKYVFFVDFTAERFGGLEHLNSTYCLTSYFELRPREEYDNLLALLSHEFFHTWNVKRMRPVGLGPFDYTKETFTKSLWIAEGITSYYEDIILRRAGIRSVPEYLDALANSISLAKSLPAYRSASPEESSFDSWIKYYRESENTPNVSPSYYEQGTLLGLALDLQIRNDTEGAKSLDDAMRKLYRETYVREDRGYTDAEFETACTAVAGRSEGLSEIFEKNVRGRDLVDFSRVLGYAGLKLAPKSGVDNTQQPQTGFLGAKVRPSPNPIVETTLAGSPAQRADLSAGDEIVGVDGLRVDSPKLAFYIATREPGTEIGLLISRGGVLGERKVTLGLRPIFDYRIQKKEASTLGEQSVFLGWMRSAWDAPLSYVEYRQSPIRRRLLDYI